MPSPFRSLFPTKSLANALAKLMVIFLVLKITHLCFENVSGIAKVLSSSSSPETIKVKPKDSGENIILREAFEVIEREEPKERDLYNLSKSEQEEFFAERQKVYAHRREVVNRNCKYLREETGQPKLLKLTSLVRPASIRYNAKDKVAICAICKVGSSTWARNFLSLASPEIQAKYRRRIHMEAKAVWPLPADLPIHEAFDRVEAMVFSRHPFSRIVSAYYNKVVERNWYRDAVIKTWKQKMGIDPNMTVEGSPSPTAWAAYLTLHPTSNLHWRPQTYTCPFCVANFSIYARLEDSTADTAYFLLHNNLTDRISHEAHHNKRTEADQTVEKFWSSVPESLTSELYATFITDFRLLDYNVYDYFMEMGMEGLASRLKHLDDTDMGEFLAPVGEEDPELMRNN